MTPKQMELLAGILPAGTCINISWTVGDTPTDGPATPSHPTQVSASAHAANTEECLPGEHQMVKVKEAHKHFSPSAREFKRAVKHGWLDVTEKEGGRDAGAHMLSTTDIRAYVERRQRIREGLEPVPANWPDKGVDLGADS